MEITTEILRQHAGHTREIFERILTDCYGSPDTLNTCAFTSYTLSLLLNRFLPVDARVRGGDGAHDGGFRGPSGRLHGHYWVEVASKEVPPRHWVVDITADQFGAEPIIVFSPEEASGRYYPGDQAVVDEHMLEVRDLCIPDETP